MKISQVDLNALTSQATPSFNSSTTIGEIISKLVPYFFFFSGAAFLIYLVFGGISLMTCRGDAKAAASAKEKITWGFVGFLIVFCAYWIVEVMGAFLGLKGISDVFK